MITVYKCSACGEIGVPATLSWCSVANYEHRYEEAYRTDAHAVPVESRIIEGTHA